LRRRSQAENFCDIGREQQFYDAGRDKILASANVQHSKSSRKSRALFAG